MEYWWEKLQRQCPKCKKFLAMEMIKETENFFYWRCQFCGFSRKHERSWVIFKTIKGKEYFKTNKMKRFERVGLKRTAEYLKVISLEENDKHSPKKPL